MTKFTGIRKRSDDEESLKEALEKSKDQIFVCMMCGKENKGLVFCDHKRGEEVE